MKSLFILTWLLVTNISYADMPVMVPLTILTPTTWAPSFCEQYPGADVCTPKHSDTVQYRCLDDQLYHKVYGLDGHSEWKLVFVNNQPEACSGNYQE